MSFDLPLEEGVREVYSFESFKEFRSFVDAEGYYTGDPVLQALLDGKAITLLVENEILSKVFHVLKDQLKRVKVLQGLEEGVCYELLPLLEASYVGRDSEHDESFERGRFLKFWPDIYAFILDPEQALRPLDEFRGASMYLRKQRKSSWLSEIFDIQVCAFHLDFRALRKAADAALKEIEQGC